MRRGIEFLCVGIFALAGFFPPPVATIRPVDPSSKADLSLWTRAQTSSEPLRLLVRLAVPFVAEGRRSSQSAQVQRSEITRGQDRVLALLSERDVSSVRRFRHVPFLALEVEPAALADLVASPEVVSVFEDIPATATLTESVPLIGADVAWSMGYSGQGQTIVILDTGVDSTHPFLVGKVQAGACFSGAFSPSTSLCPNGLRTDFGANSGSDCAPSLAACSHGTHVAGIAAGRGTTFSGVARDAAIVSIQVFSRFDTDTYCGAGLSPCVLSWTSDQIAALDYVYSTVRNSYAVAAVNMSLGGGSSSIPCDGDSRKLAIDNLRSVGIATVIAAGNQGSRSGVAFPACISTAISVGSTNDNDQVSSFSNVASFLSLFGPGESILSSVPGGGFQNFSGTSMAAPHVAGAWAILRSKDPIASVTTVLGTFALSGVPVLDSRTGGTVSRPRIQVDAALLLLPAPAEATSTPSLTPTTTPSANLTSTSTSPATETATVTPTMAATATATLTSSLTPVATPTASGPVVGDLDLDGVVNILDVQLCVNVFLGTEGSAAIVSRSDMNSDGQTNVVDVQLLVNIILAS